MHRRPTRTNPLWCCTHFWWADLVPDPETLGTNHQCDLGSHLGHHSFCFSVVFSPSFSLCTYLQSFDVVERMCIVQVGCASFTLVSHPSRLESLAANPPRLLCNDWVLAVLSRFTLAANWRSHATSCLPASSGPIKHKGQGPWRHKRAVHGTSHELRTKRPGECNPQGPVAGTVLGPKCGRCCRA